MDPDHRVCDQLQKTSLRAQPAHFCNRARLIFSGFSVFECRVFHSQACDWNYSSPVRTRVSAILGNFQFFGLARSSGLHDRARSRQGFRLKVFGEVRHPQCSCNTLIQNNGGLHEIGLPYHNKDYYCGASLVIEATKHLVEEVDDVCWVSPTEALSLHATEAQ